MTAVHNTVFISYRRTTSSYAARAVFFDLRQHGYDVFMDVESINAGHFAEVILNQIQARAHFVLILAPGSLERCDEPGDWLRREIETAMSSGRNIIPVLVNDFRFDADTDRYLTGALADLKRFNALTAPHDYFEEAMQRLRTRFLQLPMSGEIIPAPAEQQSIVDEALAEAVTWPAPTLTQLSAEQFFNRGMGKYTRGNYEGAIEDFTAVVTLQPDFAPAYSQRAMIGMILGDYEAAIRDFSRAIDLDPDGGERTRDYLYRALSRVEIRQDLEAALRDLDEVLRRDSRQLEAINGRAVANIRLNRLDNAREDFLHAVEIEPDQPHGYNNLGELDFELENFESALAYFQQADALRPGYFYAQAGIAITLHALGKRAAARDLWRGLVGKDARYLDPNWFKSHLHWRDTLVEEARRLITRL